MDVQAALASIEYLQFMMMYIFNIVYLTIYIKCTIILDIIFQGQCSLSSFSWLVKLEALGA